MSLRSPIVALALALLAASAVQAHESTSRVDQRQAHQAQRIHQGVASGELTARETARLRHQQQHIRHYEQHARADGRVSAHERQRLHAMQAEASRSIRWQKHDRQERHWR